jgi:hypothetical protein
LLLPSAAPAADDRAGIRGSRPGAGVLRDGRRSPAGRGTDTTRRYRGHARPRAGLHKASWRTVPWGACHRLACQRSNARSASSHWAARTPGCSRAGTPCSPRESCSPGERGPLLVTELLAVPMLLIHAISERPPKPPPRRHGLPQADCAAWATAATRPPAAQPGRRRLPGQACGPRSAAVGTAVNTARPPRRPRPDLVVNVQPTGQSSLNPAGPNSSAASPLGAFVTAAPGERHTSPNG